MTPEEIRAGEQAVDEAIAKAVAASHAVAAASAKAYRILLLSEARSEREKTGLTRAEKRAWQDAVGECDRLRQAEKEAWEATYAAAEQLGRSDR